MRTHRRRYRRLRRECWLWIAGFRGGRVALHLWCWLRARSPWQRRFHRAGLTRELRWPFAPQRVVHDQ